MAPEPVATVHLPVRVPFGFHAYHMTEQDFANQAKEGDPSPGVIWQAAKPLKAS